MPLKFDATSKHLLQVRPADWIKLGKLPAGKSVELVDADLSVVSSAADKLLRVNGRRPYGAHFEFQASLDVDIDCRVLTYNVLGRRRLGMRVRSVVFLLRPQAWSPAVTGRIVDRSDAGHVLEFRYKLIRVWEIPVKTLLEAGVGTLPLAPISEVKESELPGVINAMKNRLAHEKSAGELWTATRF